jgi:hypothetical protein
MNARGDYYPIFRLLVIAIVVVFLLSLAIILFPSPSNDSKKYAALKEAQSILVQAHHKRYTSFTSQKIFFVNESVFNSGAIADSLGDILGDENICVSAGDFEGQADWETISMARVAYKGASRKTVLLRAICDSGEKIFEGINGEDYFEKYDPELKFGNVNWEDCGCVNPNNLNYCCLVAIKKAPLD